MITPSEPQKSVTIRESKIIHKRSEQHPLAPHVTEEAVALKFNVKIEEIHRIELWDKLVYVYAGKLSRFMSYGDFPPVVTENKASELPVHYWGNRLRTLHRQDQRQKEHKKEQLLQLWSKYYTDRVSETRNKLELRKWGEIIAVMKPYLGTDIMTTMKEFYQLILEQHQAREHKNTA